MKVAVVGCGAMGAATGWRLAARGVDVTCFDRLSPPHDLGSSHGESRMTRTAYFEGPAYVPLVQESFPMWRGLERDTGTALLTLTGGLMIGRPDAEVITGSLDAAWQHHLDAQVLTAGEVAERYPGHVLEDTDIAVLDAQAGFLRPEASIAAMIGRLKALGGAQRHDEPVLSMTAHDNGVDVTTPVATQSFDAVVLCAGARVGELSPQLPVTVERQVMAWFDLEPGVDHFDPGHSPVYYHDTGAGGGFYGFPSVDGTTLKIGRHHDGETTDADSVRREVTEADLEPLRDFATSRLRGVSGRMSRSTVCMYTNTPDRHFIVDLDPEDHRIVIVSACSGHGFKFAPVIGDIAADLAVQGTTARDIAPFSLRRLM